MKLTMNIKSLVRQRPPHSASSVSRIFILIFFSDRQKSYKMRFFYKCRVYFYMLYVKNYYFDINNTHLNVYIFVGYTKYTYVLIFILSMYIIYFHLPSNALHLRVGEIHYSRAAHHSQWRFNLEVPRTSSVLHCAFNT